MPKAGLVSFLYATGANMWTCQAQWTSRGGRKSRSESGPALCCLMKGTQHSSYLQTSYVLRCYIIHLYTF